MLLLLAKYYYKWLKYNIYILKNCCWIRNGQVVNWLVRIWQNYSKHSKFGKKQTPQVLIMSILNCYHVYLTCFWSKAVLHFKGLWLFVYTTVSHRSFCKVLNCHVKLMSSLYFFNRGYWVRHLFTRGGDTLWYTSKEKFNSLCKLS